MSTLGVGVRTSPQSPEVSSKRTSPSAAHTALSAPSRTQGLTLTPGPAARRNRAFSPLPRLTLRGPVARAPPADLSAVNAEEAVLDPVGGGPASRGAWGRGRACALTASRSWGGRS